ncbi:hypothetical protein [Streptomyces shenzhenensis]|uniref:hypothetical protein n=1 Tax=Streptomyces shenzhenensis TaxID=943815 RepID=UPI0033CC031F
MPLTPVEQLLALADLYTQHNDRIDLLFSGHAHPAPDAYVASAHRLERQALACIKGVRQQRLPAIAPVSIAVVRLKQTAYLTGGATRYLTAAQQTLPAQDADHARPDPHRGFGQYVRLARELTALAPLTIVASATHIAARLHNRARNTNTVTGIDAAQHNALLEVARGHITVTEQHGQRVHSHTTTVAVEVLRHLEAHHLVTRQPASTPPFFPGGPPRDRARLTALGISTLSAVIDAPLHISLPATRPVPAPAAANAARAKR